MTIKKADYAGAAYILAAGEGKEYKGKLLKYFAHMDHKPLFVYTTDFLAASKRFREITLIVNRDWMVLAHQRIHEWDLSIIRGILPQASTIWESLERGLETLHRAYDVICIQDGARLTTKPHVTSECMDLAFEHGICFPATYEINSKYDLIREIDGKKVGIQEPVCIKQDLLREILAKREKENIEIDNLYDLLIEIGEKPFLYFHESRNPRVITLDDIDYSLEILKSRHKK